MNQAIEVIKHYEGCRLKAYLCPAKVWTIGYGCTVYPDGTKVKEGDQITKDRAEELLRYECETRLHEMAIDGLKPHQQSALLSFQYNVGQSSFMRSTLRKYVKTNPNNNQAIYDEFMKWTRAGGNVLPGLVKRRKTEANLYTSGVIKFFT